MLERWSQLALALLLHAACGDTSPGPAASPDASHGQLSADAAAADAPAPSLDAGADLAVDSAGSSLRCDPRVGFPPRPGCSPTEPCTPKTGGELVVSSDPPTCKTTVAHQPAFDDGPAVQRTGADGLPRHGCLYRPPGATSQSPRPLVIWLHGGSGDAVNLYNATSLRTRAIDYDLSGAPSRPGFVLLSVQSRNVHYPFGRLYDGKHHDTGHWDLASPSANRDIANLDGWIDDLAADGSIDVDRIYLMGWSEGAMLSKLYGIARHAVATPGGRRVAAVAGFSATSPFDRLALTDRCALDALPTSALPVLMVSRTCDVVPCDIAQRQALWAQGSFSDVISVEEWLPLLRDTVGAQVAWRLIDDEGVEKTTCAPDCTLGRATLNHLKWPDGINDGGGVDHELAMLDFLRDHPLAATKKGSH